MSLFTKLQNQSMMFKILFTYTFIFVGILIGFFWNKEKIKQEKHNEIIERSRTITQQQQAALSYISSLHQDTSIFNHEDLAQKTQKTLSQQDFKNHEDRLNAIRKTDLYDTIPIVFLWSKNAQEAKEAHELFRTPRIHARNPDNEATELEADLLKKLDQHKLNETWTINEKTNSIHYLRAIRLTKDCLACHGTVNDDHNNDGLDPFGLKMEGLKKDDLYSAFEVVTNLNLAQHEINRTFWSNFRLVALILIFTMLLTALFYLSVFIPLKKTLHFNQNMSKGKIGTFPETTRQDEVGQLLTYTHEMSNKIKEMISEIDRVSNEISSRNLQVSTLIAHLKDGIVGQTTSLQEVSFSMEKMAQEIQQNTENANQTKELSIGTATKANITGDSVLQTTNSILTIGERISVIEEIAKKTNLLALNASLEAVRAGENGKGFAIVAVQIQKFAERSQQAAAEIVELIHKSAQIANYSSENLDSLIPNIHSTAELVQEMSLASSKQNESSQQISIAIHHLEDVALQNSDISTQISSAAEEISQLTMELQTLLNVFEIKA